MTAPIPPRTARGAAHLRGIGLLLLVTTIWGSTFAVVKVLGRLLDPPTLIAWRFLIAALALLPMLGILGRGAGVAGIGQSLRTPGLWRDGVVLGAWLIAGYGAQTTALQTTGPNRAAFFTALSVVLVPVWLAIAQRRRMPLALWLAMPLAVLGLGLLSWEGGKFVVGDAWALACAVTYAGFIVTLEKMASRYAALPFTFAQVLSVTVFGWLWDIFSGMTSPQPAHLLPPAAAWLPLLYLGVIATAVTTWLQTLGQRQVSAAEASLIYALEPVTASIFSYFLVGEKVGLRGLLGGLCVVVATVLSTQGQDSQAESEPTLNP